MTKQLKNIYPQIYDFENLHGAYLHARKNKRYRAEVLRFTESLEENLIEIQNQLIWHKYELGRYREFYVYEPKKRLIMALPFKDRIVQWALYQQLNPIFEKVYIEDSYACREGKGTHKAVEKLQYWLRKIDRGGKKYYCLKMDISKYFYRVDHEVLMKILRKKINDQDVLWLLNEIVNSEATAFGLPLGYRPEDVDIRLTDKGMPIGNLSSQMFANLYLNELDQFVKRNLKMKYYIRYMDDFLILHDDKRELHDILDAVREFLETELKLNLNNKTSIRPVSLGIEFVGYRVWSTHVKLRKSSTMKMKKRLKYLQNQYSKGKVNLDKINCTVQSYLGILKHCNSYSLTNKIFNNFKLKREEKSMLPIQKKLIKYNYSSGNDIKYIVVHDTANTGKGANALAHFNYFNGGDRQASAHYFVDDSNIIQTVEDSNAAWHCGDGNGVYGITNHNSIGIETCVNCDGNYERAIENTLDLVKYLMAKYNIPVERVVRHYDASRKNCPAQMNRNGDWSSWNNFKNRLQGQATSTPSNNIGVGTKVKVTGSNYATGQNIPAWVKQNTYTVTQVSGNKALLSDIVSWVYMSDLLVVGSSAAPQPSNNIGVGTKVKVTGSNYATGQSIPTWVKENAYTVTQINGNKALLSDIVSWVYISDLVVAGSSTAPQQSSKMGTVTASVLNVRSGAGTNYPVIGQLKNGQQVKLDTKVGNWWSIYFGDHGGFVSADYIQC